jgi:hypothetical protein
MPLVPQVTRLEQAMNRVVMGVLAILASLAVVFGGVNIGWELRHNPGRDWYLGQQVRAERMGLRVLGVQVWVCRALAVRDV